MPQYFYKPKFREASEFDRQEYRISYAVDVYLLDDAGKTSSVEYESYGFIITEDNANDILKIAFNNDFLFKQFIKLDT